MPRDTLLDLQEQDRPDGWGMLVFANRLEAEIASPREPLAVAPAFAPLSPTEIIDWMEERNGVLGGLIRRAQKDLPERMRAALTGPEDAGKIIGAAGYAARLWANARDWSDTVWRARLVGPFRSFQPEYARMADGIIAGIESLPARLRREVDAIASLPPDAPIRVSLDVDMDPPNLAEINAGVRRLERELGASPDAQRLQALGDALSALHAASQPRRRPRTGTGTALFALIVLPITALLGIANHFLKQLGRK